MQCHKHNQTFWPSRQTSNQYKLAAELIDHNLTEQFVKTVYIVLDGIQATQRDPEKELLAFGTWSQELSPLKSAFLMLQR